MDLEKYVYLIKEDVLLIFILFDFNLDGFVDDKECVDVINVIYVEFFFYVEKFKFDFWYFICFSEFVVFF